MGPEAKTIYTIMAEYTGAYGWVVRSGDESQGVGGNVADHSGWRGNHTISEALHEDFVAWQNHWEEYVTTEDEHEPFDWASFHERGVALCRRLKEGLGDAERIIYEKPFGDPHPEVDERREILADGTLAPLLPREQVNCVRVTRLVARIVSGGQTGADRAALDWAIAHAVPHGGWCPEGRRAEDGSIDVRYQLREMPSRGYKQRTRKNVEDSDGTLILNLGVLEGGTLQTRRFAERLGTPFRVVQLDACETEEARLQTLRWLRSHQVRCLNIAGPRESSRPGIYAAVTAFLDVLDQGYDPPRDESRSGDK